MYCVLHVHFFISHIKINVQLLIDMFALNFYIKRNIVLLWCYFEEGVLVSLHEKAGANFP